MPPDRGSHDGSAVGSPLKLFEYAPVSYTHLDVYKRQWERCFTDTQAAEVHEIIGLMFAEQGGETNSACHPVFMHAADQRLDA